MQFVGGGSASFSLADVSKAASRRRSRAGPVSPASNRDACAASAFQAYHRTILHSVISLSFFHSLMALWPMTGFQRIFSPSRTFRVPGSGWRFEGWNPACPAASATKVRTSMSGGPAGP